MKHTFGLERIGLLLLLGLLSGCDGKSTTVEGPPVAISNAYVRTPIATSTTATGYFMLANSKDKARTLVSVKSELARAVEIHEHQLDNGTMRMRRLPNITVGADESIEFQPGAKHLMMFGFVPAGATIDQLTFEFDDGLSVTVTAPLKSLLD